MSDEAPPNGHYGPPGIETEIEKFLRSALAGRGRVRYRNIRQAIQGFLAKQATDAGFLVAPERAEEQAAVTEILMMQFMPQGRPDLRALCGRITDEYLKFLIRGVDQDHASPFHRILMLDFSRRQELIQDWSYEWTSDDEGVVKVQQNAHLEGDVPADINLGSAACGCICRVNGTRIQMALHPECEEHGDKSDFKKFFPWMEQLVELLLFVEGT